MAFTLYSHVIKTGSTTVALYGPRDEVGRPMLPVAVKRVSSSFHWILPIHCSKCLAPRLNARWNWRSTPWVYLMHQFLSIHLQDSADLAVRKICFVERLSQSVVSQRPRATMITFWINSKIHKSKLIIGFIDFSLMDFDLWLWISSELII